MNPRFFAARLQLEADRSLAQMQQTNGLANLSRVVAIRIVTVTGSIPATQIPGSRVSVDTLILPAPRVIEDGNAFNQYLDLWGGRVEEENLLISRIPRIYTESQLRGVATVAPNEFHWVVDTVQYKLLGLARTITGWDAMVKRDRA